VSIILTHVKLHKKIFSTPLCVDVQLCLTTVLVLGNSKASVHFWHSQFILLFILHVYNSIFTVEGLKINCVEVKMAAINVALVLLAIGGPLPFKKRLSTCSLLVPPFLSNVQLPKARFFVVLMTTMDLK